MLCEMKNSDELTDVTLVCDDKKQFKGHKVVLSACSTVFKSIINNLPQNNSVIYLRGVATVHQDNIDDFLNVAKNLEIKEIAVYESEVEKDDKEITDYSNISDKVMKQNLS